MNITVTLQTAKAGVQKVFNVSFGIANFDEATDKIAECKSEGDLINLSNTGLITIK